MRKTLLIAALGALYFLSAWFGLTFFSPAHPNVAAVWPPSGVAIAALVLFGRGVWPGVYLGAFAINAATTDSLWPALLIALGNTLEGVVAAHLVARFAGGREAFTQARSMLAFAGFCALGTMIGATFGAGTLALLGQAPTGALPTLWLTWWLGDTAGAILIAPVLILWHHERGWPWSDRRLLEGALLLCAAAGTGLVAFVESSLGVYPPAFLFLPLLGWAAIRFGPREVASVVAVLSLIAAWGTAQGQGPFVRSSPNESLLVLQAFMILMSLSSVPIAAIVRERSAILERERAARAEAEAANASKDEFLAMLGHELRNPLAAIDAAASILQRGASGEEAARWHRAIGRQTEHLTRLIDDLLDVGRLTSGKLVMKREPLDLGAAAARCARALTAVDRLSPQRRVEIDAPSVWILGDPSRIDQIVTNLVGNALKYTPPEGRIRVRVSADGDHAVLRVEDSGIGIARTLLPRIFELFTQADQGLERARGGLGIGLTLVRRLAELHGGEAHAHSEGPGRGSAFIVRLPRIEAPERAAEAAAPGRSPPSGRYRILLVEDNPDARESMAALLEILGHEVRTAADGEAGIDAGLSFPFDLALIDIGLPRADGYEVARRLRAAKPHAPLLALTGYGGKEVEQRAREAGFSAHRVKPVAIDELRRSLDELMG